MLDSYPIERRTRIGLAAGRDVAMPDDRRSFQRGERRAQGPNDIAKRIVLRVRIVISVCSFEFNTNREIITAIAIVETGLTSVPGPQVQRYILHDLTVAFDQQMTRDPGIDDFRKVRMLAGIEGVGEQMVDLRSAKLAGRQRDPVDDDQLGFAVGRPLVAVGRRYLARAVDEPRCSIYCQHQSAIDH